MWVVNRVLRGWKSCVFHQLYHSLTEDAWGSPSFFKASRYPSLHIKEKGTMTKAWVSVYLICQASLQSRIILPTNSSLLSRTTHSLSWAISTTEDTSSHTQRPQGELWMPQGHLQGPKVLPKSMLGTWKTEGTVLGFSILRAGKKIPSYTCTKMKLLLSPTWLPFATDHHWPCSQEYSR